MTPGISTNKLNSFKQWFKDYTHAFFTENKKIRKNLDLKIEHTLKVCAVIQGLAHDLKLSENAIHLAEAVALFHDIGRFQQYRDYGTFSDSRSVNHGDLGASLLLEHGILIQLDALEREILGKSVQYHNRKVLPKEDNDSVRLFCKMIRDADKLDIFRVVIEYYEIQKRKARNETVELDLPDLPGLTQSVIHDLQKRHPVDMRHLQTLNDFKMIQVGWVYDMNFGYSLKQMLEKNYLRRIQKELPDLEVVHNIVNDAENYLKENGHKKIIQDSALVSA